MSTLSKSIDKEVVGQPVAFNRDTSFLNNSLAEEAIILALKEDVASGDITSEAIVPDSLCATAEVVVKESAVLAGLPVFVKTFQLVNPNIEVEVKLEEGDLIMEPPTTVAVVRGPARSILAGERTALNFLQRLSGIASTTKRYIDLASAHEITILDTRKTTPCLRAFEKYAVRVGGGTNHRWGLFDAILIKDNHLRIAGSIETAVCLARKKQPHKKIEVETTTLEEVKAALKLQVDVILLDNMSPDLVKKAVELINGQCHIEVSGGVTLNNLQSFLLPGINAISIGALTHSAVNIDISLEVTFEPWQPN